MVDGLICAIADVVKNTAGEEYVVYTESVHQKAVKPCFFIECEKAERIEVLNGGFFLRVSVKISCENDSDTKKYETDKLINALFEALRWIWIDTKAIAGRRIWGKWEDGRFVIRGCYDVWGIDSVDTDTDLMLTIEKKETV